MADSPTVGKHVRGDREPVADASAREQRARRVSQYAGWPETGTQEQARRKAAQGSPVGTWGDWELGGRRPAWKKAGLGRFSQDSRWPETGRPTTVLQEG
ncbi:hypothetical protein chiPu_0013510 [Chiloscyllium punctatum]|uniref:Uncharacterized protein n=1 Tax=Chiloscyllium punctatum TaxID=137246 RepID=A0A401SXD5_CHIPU|nr:hypothetical protein [Chiloscyllium punctatum]